MRVQARTSIEEMEDTARKVAEKLNQAPKKSMIKFVVPTRGFSSLSVEGGSLFDPASDQAFVDALKEHLDPEIEIISVDTHINTPAFADRVVAALKGISL